jgi:hypothetical protein
MRNLCSVLAIVATGLVATGCQVESPAKPAADPSLTTTPPISKPAEPVVTATPPATAAPTTTPTATAPPAPTTPVTTPPPSAKNDPNDYQSCTTDADCEIVAKAGCCDNGIKDAIAKGKGDAYRKANACTKKVMCPHYMVMDKRTAACSATKHTCELVGQAPAGAGP